MIFRSFCYSMLREATPFSFPLYCTLPSSNQIRSQISSSADISQLNNLGRKQPAIQWLILLRGVSGNFALTRTVGSAPLNSFVVVSQ